jgi:hypothetical protein
LEDRIYKKKKETIGIVIKLDPIGQLWNIST